MTFWKRSTRPADPFTHAKTVIEKALIQGGLSPERAAGMAKDDDHYWSVWVDDVELVLQLCRERESFPGPALCFYAELMRLPDDEILPVYRRMLELNGSELVGFALGVQRDQVVLTAEVDAEHLDEERFCGLMRRFRGYSDLRGKLVS